jgi:opacity protein-like surface antigen
VQVVKILLTIWLTVAGKERGVDGIQLTFGERAIFASNPMLWRIRQEKLVRQICATAFAFFALSSISAAQIPTSGNIFFGYSYSQGQAFSRSSTISVSAPSGSANMNGWEATAEGKFLPWIGAAIDFDWHYGGHDFTGCAGSSCVPVSFRLNASRHTLLLGPRASISLGRYTPFAQLLVGFTHQTDSGGGISNSDTSFSTAVGGGLDYKLIKGVAWRIQGDSLHTRLFDTGKNDFRFSTGIVFRF